MASSPYLASLHTHKSQTANNQSRAPNGVRKGRCLPSDLAWLLIQPQVSLPFLLLLFPFCSFLVSLLCSSLLSPSLPRRQGWEATAVLASILSPKAQPPLTRSKCPFFCVFFVVLSVCASLLFFYFTSSLCLLSIVFFKVFFKWQTIVSRWTFLLLLLGSSSPLPPLRWLFLYK